ncbi:phosphate ABC transporter permease PstA [candidate division WOR-3 bacterium]|nr:phosphate ABC transporter permease PstA [candidate division WOR-3 bacterium]
MKSKPIELRKTENFLFKMAVITLSSATVIPLVLILFFVAKKGIAAIDMNFLFSLPKPVGQEGGGISNAIVGTIILIALTCVMSIPLGILCGVFLAECRKSKLSFWVRTWVEVLQGVPSIVMGIVAYIWIIRPLKGLFSAFAGSVALSIMMLPLVIKATEETVKMVPDSIKEAALSLGVPYYKTVLRVVLPVSASGILTGVLLGVGRIAGETAPLLFTAFGNQFMNYNIFKPVNALPLLIYRYATSPYKDWQQIAWGASLFLIAFILLINFIASGIARKWKVKF